MHAKNARTLIGIYIMPSNSLKNRNNFVSPAVTDISCLGYFSVANIKKNEAKYNRIN